MASNEVLDTIIELHTKGLTNLAISKIIGYTDVHAGRLIRSLGLMPNGRRKRELLIDGDNAKCCICGKWKPLKSFENTRHGGKLSNCFACRYMNDKLSINRDKARFLKQAFHKLRSRSLRKGVFFDLEFEDVIDILKAQEYRCFYTDEDLWLWVGEGRNDNSLSFDRVIFDKGYTKNNLVICTKRINAVKLNLTLTEIKEWMPSFYERLKLCDWLNL